MLEDVIFIKKAIQNSDYILLDFDGVIFDTNELKESAISEASKKFCNDSYHRVFIDFFTKFNGIPRLNKIEKFFPNEKLEILKKYNQILNATYMNANLTKGALGFLEMLHINKKNTFIISGGEHKEIINLLKKNRLENFFDEILCAPYLKKDILKKFSYKKSFFIGDSKVDYESALVNKINFCFMYRYTQFYNWKEFFANKDIFIIKSLGELCRKE